MKRIFFILLFFCMGCSYPSLNGNTYHMQKNNTLIELGFDAKEDKFYGAVSNRFFGNYALRKDKIQFEVVGTTMMMSPPDIQELEDEFFRDLKEITNYRLEKDKLILLTKNHKTLVFYRVSK